MRNHEPHTKRRSSATSHSHSHKKRQEASPITPKFIFESMRRWWHIALPAGLVIATISSFLIWRFFEPVYESRAVIRIKSNPVYLISPDAAPDSENYVQNELALLKSPMVLRRVVADPEISQIPELFGQQDQEKALAKLIRIQSIEDSDYHYVYVRAHVDTDAQRMCDKLIKEYEAQRAYETGDELDRLLKELEVQEDENEKVVKRLQRELREKMQESEDIALPNPNGEDTEPLRHASLTQLNVTREIRIIDREAKQAEVQQLREEIANDDGSFPPEEEINAGVENSSQLARIETAIEETKSQLNNSRYGPDHPDNLRLTRYWNSKLEELDAAKVRVREEVRQQLLLERRKELEAMEKELVRMDFEIASLNDAIEHHVEELNEDKDVMLDIDFIIADLEDARAMRDQFAQRRILIQSERRAPNRVTIDASEQGEEFIKASLPTAPVEKYPIRQMSLASLASMLFPFLLAFLWELRVHRVSNPEQVESNASVPIVGEVAALPGRTRGVRSSRRVDRQMKLFEESVDTLRTSFFLTLKSEECQVISITSAVANEGKTTVASQLALSVSRASNKRVLLIDGDLRAPDIHRVFDVDNDLGVTDVLRGDCSVDEAIAASWEDNLFILPGGRLRGDSPHQLVSEGKFAEMVNNLRSQFDVIVLDTSPVLSSSESLLVNQAADHTLVSVMRDVSRVEQVKKLAERMQMSGVHVAGCIMNGVSHSRYAYSYGVYETSNG